MESTIGALQAEQAQILQRLGSLGAFRRGTVTANYRKCGKPTCHCNNNNERGHGPRYLWSATIGGKNYARSLRTETEVKRYEEETSRYRVFQLLCERLTEVNERLCEVQHSQENEKAEAQAQEKKKPQKRLRKNATKR
jgi:hypothetical protein